MQSNFQSTDQSRSFIETARRAQIIECAILTIAELGYAQASLARIAKRAGISAGVISYYFAGKDDLIAEVARHVFAVGETFVRAQLVGLETARAALRAFIVANIAYLANHPAYVVALMDIVRAGPRERNAVMTEGALGEGRRKGIASILEWGQRSGEFRSFAVPVMTVTLIEAIDAIPPAIAADPDLALGEYAHELAELFDRATRNDPVENVR